MNVLSRLSIIGVAAGVVLSIVIASQSFAEAPLTTEQQQHIQTSCLTIKNTLNQLHVSDALLRVNRGQFYESMASKLMDRFSARLTSNGIDATTFQAITNSYRSTLDAFRSDYQTYEQQLSTTIGIDCTKQPVTFYNDVLQSRSKRTTVHDDVTKLNQEMSDYQAAVTAFANKYHQVSSGGTQ